MNERISNSTANLADVLPKDYLISSLKDLYKKGLPTGLYTGVDALDDLFRLDTSRLCTVTGIPNDGKSEFVDFLTTTYNKKYGLKTLYFSPENQPVAAHLAKLVSKFTGKHFDKSSLTADEVVESVSHITDDFFFCNYQRVATSKQIIEVSERLIREEGVKIIVVDAFNKIESENGTEDNLLYISKLLDTLCAFAIKEDILIILVAHPKKMEAGRVPTPYDINGSANFFNKSDFVFTVQRTRRTKDDTRVIIDVGKVKFSNYGSQGRVELEYDKESGNYYDPAGSEVVYNLNDNDFDDE